MRVMLDSGRISVILAFVLLSGCQTNELETKPFQEVRLTPAIAFPHQRVVIEAPEITVGQDHSVLFPVLRNGAIRDTAAIVFAIAPGRLSVAVPPDATDGLITIRSGQYLGQAQFIRKRYQARRLIERGGLVDGPVGTARSNQVYMLYPTPAGVYWFDDLGTGDFAIRMLENNQVRTLQTVSLRTKWIRTMSPTEFVYQTDSVFVRALNLVTGAIRPIQTPQPNQWPATIRRFRSFTTDATGTVYGAEEESGRILSFTSNQLNHIAGRPYFYGPAQDGPALQVSLSADQIGVSPDGQTIVISGWAGAQRIQNGQVQRLFPEYQLVNGRGSRSVDSYDALRQGSGTSDHAEYISVRNDGAFLMCWGSRIRQYLPSGELVTLWSLEDDGTARTYIRFAAYVGQDSIVAIRDGGIDLITPAN